MPERTPRTTKGRQGRSRPARVALLSRSRVGARRLAASLEAQGVSCAVCEPTVDGVRGLGDPGIDLALIDLDARRAPGVEIASSLMDELGLASVLVTSEPSLDLAVEAMRRGALDVISPSLDAGTMGVRVIEAARRGREIALREDQVRRLKKMCRNLNSARHDVTEQVGSLCNDLVEAYQGLAEQFSCVTLASEFRSLIRQELEVESLLRAVLEYLLGKLGPMNAAVFLPSHDDEYSLGAYVNYDCPKDAAEVLLDQLAAVAAPAFEDLDDVLMLDERALRARLGAEAHWLGGSETIAFACRHDAETLAVVLLFRDKHSPFASDARELLGVVQEQFTAQLARVIRIHHRHLPKNQWGLMGADDDWDDLDLAA